MFADGFAHSALPMNVTFGRGMSPVKEHVDSLGFRRPMVISTHNRTPLARSVVEVIAPVEAEIYPGAVAHVPVAVVDHAEKRARDMGCDGYIAVGGGAPIGLAKALALRTSHPIIAIPTTYAGSEMTPVWGLTENNVKRTGRDPVVLPRAVVYDPNLTISLPAPVSVTSGMNAIAHAVEALYAPDTSPIVAMMAREGARALTAALPRIVSDPTELAARSEALYGSWLCGAVLGSTTMALHHKLCHILGGTFDLPHAQVHAIVLPHVLAFNAPFAPQMVAGLDDVFGAGDPWTALWDLQTSLPMPIALSEVGFREGDIAEVVRQVLAIPYYNPRPVVAAEITALLGRALVGSTPTP